MSFRPYFQKHGLVIAIAPCLACGPDQAHNQATESSTSESSEGQGGTHDEGVGTSSSASTEETGSTTGPGGPFPCDGTEHVWAGGASLRYPGDELPFAGYTVFEGGISIRVSEYVHFEGLDCLHTIRGDLLIESNDNLESFSGLRALRRIDGNLDIHGNDKLSRIAAFDSLERIGNLFRLGGLPITVLPPLDQVTTVRAIYFSELDIVDLAPLSGLREVLNLQLRDLPITDLSPLVGAIPLLEIVDLQDLPGVTDIDVLAGVTHLEDFTLARTGVTSLTPLADLQSVEGDLLIHENQALVGAADLAALEEVGQEVFFCGNAMMLDLPENLAMAGEHVTVVHNASLPQTDAETWASRFASPPRAADNAGDTLGLRSPCPWDGDGYCDGPAKNRTMDYVEWVYCETEPCCLRSGGPVPVYGPIGICADETDQDCGPFDGTGDSRR